MQIFRYLTSISTILLVCGYFTYSTAAPHNGDEFEFRQPDGSTVPVVVWGDEFYQRVETPDGYTLIRNKETGWICYAELSEDSMEFVPTDNIYTTEKGLSKSLSTPRVLPSPHIKILSSSRMKKHQTVQQQLNRSTANAPPSTVMPAAPATSDNSGAIHPLADVKPRFGRYTGLTILIDFSDQNATVPIDSIRDFVNKRGYTGFGNSGSVRDFYFDVSGGKVNYENMVVGYYRAKKTKSYYDNSSDAFGNRSQELILEALDWLHADSFDFNQLTLYPSAMNPSRVKIQALNILYAGNPDQGWSEGLWPHQGRLNSVRIGDIYADIYQMSNIGTSISIGTFCHENGHMLFFWPDLYDYGGESGGVGIYCLMCNTGKKNPVPPCAYLRDVSGWDAVTDITDLPKGTVLTQVPAVQNTSCIYRNKANKDEMFYIEARRPKGRYKDLPDSGFMIWHIDRNGSNDNEQGSASSHYQVSIEQADNAFELEYNINFGRRGDLFRGGYKTSFDDTTKPNALWWNGSKSGMQIYSMSAVADTMSFCIGKSNGTLHTIFVSAGANGTITPSGRLLAVAGSTLEFVIKPDSGYMADAITIDGAMVPVVDTLPLEAISADHTVEVVFGPSAALGVVYPQENAVLYSGDTAIIMWRTRGIKVTGINTFYSINGGTSFTPIASAIPAADTVFKWKVPVAESDKCIVKVAGGDGSPEARSGIFSIKKKPTISVATETLRLSVEPGRSREHTLSITNTGIGELDITATTRGLVKNVLINELYVGTDGNGINDGVEIWNKGFDIDLSGWQLSITYSQQAPKYYSFSEGFILKGGAALFLDDKVHELNDSIAYIGTDLPWSYRQGLDLSVALYDAGGIGVDFIKSSGNTDRAPDGTAWRGAGIELTDSYVFRQSEVDSDSAADWRCSPTGSLMHINPAQQVSTHPLMTIYPLNGKTQAGAERNLTITLDATNREEGDYFDTLIVRHNDPGRVSPLLIPCIITVSTAIGVVTERPIAADRTSSASPFTAAPNPVPLGEKVSFRYQPKEDDFSGTLLIFNSVGDCLFTDKFIVSLADIRNKQPLHVSWQPSNVHRQRSLLARLIVKKVDGSKQVHSTLIGIK